MRLAESDWLSMTYNRNVTRSQQQDDGGRLKKVEGNLRKSLIINEIFFSNDSDLSHEAEPCEVRPMQEAAPDPAGPAPGFASVLQLRWSGSRLRKSKC
jgi:hypothetical protein